MIRAMIWLVVWLAIGSGIVGFTAKMTDITAASPWAYTVRSNALGIGSVSVTEDSKEGEVHLVNLSSDLPSHVAVDRRVDMGVISFLFALYGGGTIMGLLLRRRPRLFTEQNA